MARRVRLAAVNDGDTVGVAGASAIHEAPDLFLHDPHPLVVAFYGSLAESTQAQFYEPSDWYTAQIICWHLDQQIKQVENEGKRPNAQMLQAILSQFDDLMITAGARQAAEAQRARMAAQSDDAATGEDARLAEIRALFAEQVSGG